MAGQSQRTLADYGLAHPALTLIFTSAGKSYVTKIGDSTKIGDRLYLLAPDGRTIHVVNRSLTDSLERPLEDIRSESIFTIPVFEVRSLSLQTAAPANLKVRLRRDGARWAFETPILARANKAGVEGTINALNALQTRNFLAPADPRLEQAGLDAPTLRVTLEGNARRETLLLGAAAAPGEFYAKIENKAAVFTVALPPRLLADLHGAQETLRDRHVLDFDPPTVTSLALAAPGQPELSLQRLEAGQGAESWQLVVRSGSGQAPQTLAADTAVVHELLQKLQLLAATKFLSDAPSAADLENYGFNRPEREITLNLSTGGGLTGNTPSALTLQIGVAPDQRAVAYARVTNAPYVYQIDPAVLRDAPALVRHYRQRILRELPAGARIGGLRLTDLATGRLLLEKTAPTDAGLTAESLAPDPAPEPRRKALASLLAELRTLRARRFLADTFTPDHAELNGEAHPWKYRLEVTLALEGGSGTAQTTTSTLVFTDRLGGTTQLAGTAEFGGVVFEVTQELLDALFTLTYAEQHDPGPPPPEPVPPAAATPKR
ncbi:MAG: DUF4340 domain-containing protein [Opitutae bacterium]|nr:DUF4340 domain-containing protein [Opitutae bacterium]